MKFTTVGEYLASLPKPTQKLLKQVRAVVKAAAPGAREKLSYQIGAFELDGKNLIGYAGWANHISLYPIPSGSDAFNREASKYAAGKGTLKFPLDEPLPLKFISKIVKYRIENLKHSDTKYGK